MSAETEDVNKILTRATLNGPAGHMRPAGRRFPTPGLEQGFLECFITKMGFLSLKKVGDH